MTASINAAVTADRADRLLPILKKAALRAERCPTAEALAKRLCTTTQSTLVAMRLLEQRGDIVVESKSNYRIVTICATGHKTVPPVHKTRNVAPKVRHSALPLTTINVLRMINEAKAAGEPWPTQAVMAEAIGVRRNVVARAIAALREEGTLPLPTPKPPRPPRKGEVKRFTADDWEADIRRGSIALITAIRRDQSIRDGSAALLAAIRQHHPEMLAA